MGTAADRLTNEARKLVGKNWSKSSLTREKLLQNIRAIAKFMASQGLQHISNMKSKHVGRYFDNLKSRGLAPSTMQNHATALRLIAGSIGKANIVPKSNNELGITRTDRYKPVLANQAKLSTIRERLAQTDQRLLAAYDLRDAFGLRSKESLCSREIVERDGKLYLKVEGAKGGRPRQLEISTEKQVAAIRQVQQIIDAQGTRTLIPDGTTLREYYNFQKNTLYSLGARRADGSNMHAQRHAFAQAEVSVGKNSGVVQTELGHGEQRTLRHYVPQ